MLSNIQHAFLGHLLLHLTYPYRPSRGQRVIISKPQGLCQIKLCGLQYLRPAVSQRLLQSTVRDPLYAVCNL